MVPTQVETLLQGCLQQCQNPECVQIYCENGSLTVDILVLSFICQKWLRPEISEDTALILPAVKMEDVEVFLTCLQTYTFSDGMQPRLECAIANLNPYFELSPLLQEDNQDSSESEGDNYYPEVLDHDNIETIKDEDFKGNFSDQEGRLVCLVCYKMFQPNSYSLLRQHLSTHSDHLLKKIHMTFGESKLKKKNLKCPKCDFVSQDPASLNAHSKKHLQKSFQCNICKKNLFSEKLLQKHAESKTCHLSKRKCTICEKVFSDSTRLKNHVKTTHHKEKPWTCDICDKSFSELRSLKEHKLIHQPEKKFKCQFCDKKFTQKNHLKYHTASNHGQSLALLKCQICDKAFAFPFQLRKHEKSHKN